MKNPILQLMSHVLSWIRASWLPSLIYSIVSNHYLFIITTFCFLFEGRWPCHSISLELLPKLCHALYTRTYPAPTLG